MSKILTDGTQLLFECILCHQCKPLSMVEKHGNIYTCCSCTEPPHPQFEITIIPTPSTKSITIPTPTEFNLFFDDLLFHKTLPVSVLVNNTLTLTEPKGNKSIQININAILQLIAEKNLHPTICESTTKLTPVDTQNYIQNLYTATEKQLNNALLKFNKLISLEDTRIRELCTAFHELNSNPLKLRLQFLEWEKTLISGYISTEIQKGLHEKDKFVSKIQQEYSDSLEKEKVANNTKLENYKREILRLQEMNNSLNSLRSSSKEEINTLKLDKDELYGKYKALELQLQEKDAEVIKLKFDSEKLKKELEKHKIAEEWMLDPTSTDEEPIYFNQVTGEHVTYPPHFKDDYKPESVDMPNDILIYKEKSGTKEFKLPKSLMRFVKSVPTAENGTTVLTNEKLGEPETKILNVLSRNKEEALTRKEICDSTGISPSHIGTYLKKMVKMNLIISFKDDKDERFYRT